MLKFSSDLPYPIVEAEDNLADAKLLMPSYAGAGSELTAILTYSFQSFITPAAHAPMSSAYAPHSPLSFPYGAPLPQNDARTAAPNPSPISQEPMKPASDADALVPPMPQAPAPAQDVSLSRALSAISKCEMRHFELLGRAIYKLGGYPIMGARTYHSGNMVCYTLDPHKFLAQNIAAEEAAIVGYERTVLNLRSESVKLLIERIILDEELHIAAFKSLLQSL